MSNLDAGFGTETGSSAEEAPDWTGKIPDEFVDEADMLQHMRGEFADDINFDRLNREAALEDQRFLVGDQWADPVRQRREAARKPVLTFNRLPAFLSTIVGNRRLNETQIRVTADVGGKVPIAEVREGLIRNIQKESRADEIYDRTLLNAAACGIGNFALTLDYDAPDVFYQSIRMRELPDPLSVVWDRQLVEPTGSDAGHCFIIETILLSDFKALWPWARASDMMYDLTLRGDLRANGWVADQSVRIVSWWRMCSRKRTIALMDDGTTQDVTDRMDDPEAVSHIVLRPEDNEPIMREINQPYAQMWLCSGVDILAGPYELPISRLPVFRVPGWEVWVAEWKHRWGLLRFLKDPQRLHNYWRSVVAERLMLTPRASWVAADTAVAGRENQWRQAHLTDDPLLIWNAESGQKPERIQPANVEQALVGEADITAQDLKDIANIHEAALGEESNEVSGEAIIARQRIADLGTILYHDNLNHAIEECGKVMNELIPVVYDTPRIIKVLGEDSKADLVAINDTGNPANVDLDTGKYAVSFTTGPSYTTKRVEAQAGMLNLINAFPQAAPNILDLYVEAQDWPKAREIARRWRMTLPPGMVPPEDMTPEERQAMGQKQQAAAAAQQIQTAAATSQIDLNRAKTAEAEARAGHLAQQTQLMPSEMASKQVETASKAADREAKNVIEAHKIGTT